MDLIRNAEFHACTTNIYFSNTFFPRKRLFLLFQPDFMEQMWKNTLTFEWLQCQAHLLLDTNWIMHNNYYRGAFAAFSPTILQIFALKCGFVRELWVLLWMSICLCVCVQAFWYLLAIRNMRVVVSSFSLVLIFRILSVECKMVYARLKTKLSAKLCVLSFTFFFLFLALSHSISQSLFLLYI